VIDKNNHSINNYLEGKSDLSVPKPGGNRTGLGWDQLGLICKVYKIFVVINFLKENNND
jgi:hypothetical protein